MSGLSFEEIADAWNLIEDVAQRALNMTPPSTPIQEQPMIEDLIKEVEQLLEPLRAAGHEVQFELSYYLGWRDMGEKIYSMWWHASIARSRNDIGVSATERTPAEAIRVAIGFAREYTERFSV